MKPSPRGGSFPFSDFSPRLFPRALFILSNLRIRLLRTPNRTRGGRGGTGGISGEGCILPRCAARPERIRSERVHPPPLPVRTDSAHQYGTLRTSKTGRRRENVPVFRTIDFPAESAEGEFLRELMARRGPEPPAGVRAAQFQFAWYRARKKIGIPPESMQELRPHALRHDFA